MSSLSVPKVPSFPKTVSVLQPAAAVPAAAQNVIQPIPTHEVNQPSEGKSGVFLVPPAFKYSPADAARAVGIVTDSLYRKMTEDLRNNRWKVTFVTELLGRLADEMETSRREADAANPEDGPSDVHLNVTLLIADMRSQGFGFDHIAQVATGLIVYMVRDWEKDPLRPL